MSQDAGPAFDWSARYRGGDTPWDHGRAHPELERRLAVGELEPPRRGESRALVPGSGRGHDAVALARAGWRVTAIDSAPEVAAHASAALGGLGGRFELADALEHRTREPYELVFEHTFLCALPPAARPRWAALVERVLAPGGRLAVLVFPAGKELASGGPPWGFAAGDVAALVGSRFRLLADEIARARFESRQWPERWACFERELRMPAKLAGS
jgi:SAM-dependent methyltransferase